MKYESNKESKIRHQALVKDVFDKKTKKPTKKRICQNPNRDEHPIDNKNRFLCSICHRLLSMSINDGVTNLRFRY